MQDYVDDGEIAAGRALLSVLKEEKVMNVVVFLVRYYGGQHLGAARFDLFKQLATSAVNALRKDINEYKKRKQREQEKQLQQTAQIISDPNLMVPNTRWEDSGPPTETWNKKQE